MIFTTIANYPDSML